MGRYDKIKVYDDSGWVNPSRIRIYSNGTWKDLGDKLSDNTQSLNVCVDNQWVRATLNRTIQPGSGDKYANGQFKIKPENGFSYYPTGSAFQFKCTIRRTSNTKKLLFRSGVYSGSTLTSYFQIYWETDGKFTIENHSSYGGGYYSYTSKVAIPLNTWVKINAYVNKGTTTLHFDYYTLDGTIPLKQETSSMYGQYAVGSCINVVGANSIDFKDDITVKGYKASDGGSACTVTFNISNETGSGTSQHTAFNKYNPEEVILWT